MHYLSRSLFHYLLLTVGLSLALLLAFEQVVWAGENTTTPIHRQRCNDKRLQPTLTAWQEVDLVYDRLFPYDRARQPHPPAKCVVLPAISHHIYKQATEITPSTVLMLQCQEHIDLLRPARWVINRLHQQNRQGYLWLSIPEMGIMDVQVHMVAIRPSSFNPAILDVNSTASRPVIGLFIRHTMNVKKYTFKDTITGKLEQIKATPNHPFYVVNRHRYIPVSHLCTHDKLVNVLGHPVTLVCPSGKSSHCGQPYHPGQVITVYNLEVYGQHRYFVGEPGIMVHNVYYCRGCNLIYRSRYAFNLHMESTVHMMHEIYGSNNERFKYNNEPTFRCELCKEKFPLRHMRIEHLKKDHIGPFKCNYCNQKYDNALAFIKHVRKESEDAKRRETDAIRNSSEETEQTEQREERERSRSPLSPRPPRPLADNPSDLMFDIFLAEISNYL